MATATLPDSLQTKLHVLSRRLHRLRLARSISITLLVMLVGGGIAAALDAWLELSSASRYLLSGAWLGSTLFVAWRQLLYPLHRPVTARGLAAAVEEEYPRLGERLMSAVEVADSADGHGSPAFIRLLIRETDQKTRALDFRRAAPPRTTARLTVGLIATLLLAAAPAVFAPDYFVGLTRRLFMPWDRSPAVLPFAVKVTPGTAYSARGRPLTIGVELQRTRMGARLPESCTLVLTAGDSRPLRMRMPAGGGPNSFAFHIDELKETFRYFVEVGPIETDTCILIAVDPVELEGGPTTRLSPPAYAKALGAQTVDGPADLTVLEHGLISIDCKFDRPAESAALLYTPTNVADTALQRRALKLSEDRRSGRIELPALASAKIRLELDGGHGITTLTPEQSLIVVPDRPPEFRRATGLPDHGPIRPNDALALDLVIADDLAVVAAEVEFRVNDGPVRREPLALAGLGSHEAAGHAEFKLVGKAKDGDKLFVRLRAVDNRNVPEAKLGPNVTTFPAGERWNELRVSADADSARQQEVTARRDDIEKRLRDLIAQVDRATRRTYGLHQNIEQGHASAEEQNQTIQELSNEQTVLIKKLAEIAADASIAGSKPLADQMVAIGEHEFRQATEAFREAGMAAGKGRIVPLQQADSSLTDARTKLEALLQENRDLADAQLDEVKLNELAERERELAEEAKKTVSPEERERLAKEQEQLAEELKELTENDDKLRDAVETAQSDDARKLAEEARKLAQTERELDARLAEAERRRNIAKLADFARQQQKLATDADRLARQTQSAARMVPTPKLDARPAAKAADDLKTGDADSAQQRQEQSARELDRIADNLKRGIEMAKDPREAAQQLRRLQEENLKRLTDRPAEKPVVRQEQEAIRNAIEGLKVPEDNAAVRRDRQQAAELAAEAARRLTQNDSENAEFRMGQAKEALDRLAKDLPALDDRRRRALDELSQLRAIQSEIAKLAKEAAMAGEKGDRKAANNAKAEAAREQAHVAERLSKLDAPGQDARRDRATKAAARAEDDLQSPASPDVAASQAQAEKALERLADGLAGKTPADDKARALAREERDLAAAVAKSAGDANAERGLRKRQEKVVEETQGLNASDAAVRQGEAIQAAAQANSAVRDKPKDVGTPQKLRVAAEKLDALADQITGRESEAARADRLANKQEALANQPPANKVDAKQQVNQIVAEAKHIRAGEQAAAAKKEALDSLRRLKDAPSDNAQARQDAAQSLRRLADEMNRKPADDAVPRADELARQQRELNRETEAARQQPGANETLEKLADRQQQLGQQASRLPTEQAPTAVQQARQAMQQAEQALTRQDTAQAAQKQQQAANALDKASRQMTQKTTAAQKEQPAPAGMPTPGQVDQARELARRQREIQEGVRRATEGDQPSENERAVASRQQQDMARQAGDLARSLDQSARAMSGDEARQSAQGAASSARQGQQSLQQAQSNDSRQAKQARKQAAESLDRAAGQAERAARANQPGTPQNGQPQAGQQLQTAQGQMKQAQNQLGQNQSQQASDSMRRAADALQEAGKQVGEPRSPREGATAPAQVAIQGKGTPTAADMPKDLQKYAGKKWGELPGELRTRIVQDMKAQYGDDYGRVIKLYFEQIAENNGKK